MDRAWWTQGGVESPLARVIIFLVTLAVVGVLISKGVIGGKKTKDDCGGCPGGSVCVQLQELKLKDGKKRLESLAGPSCLTRCDPAAPSCPTWETCEPTAGGVAYCLSLH